MTGPTQVTGQPDQAAGVIDVLVTTYETGREDLVVFTGRSGRARTE